MEPENELEHEIDEEFGIWSLEKRFKGRDIDDILPAKRINEEKGEGRATPSENLVPDFVEFAMI